MKDEEIIRMYFSRDERAIKATDEKYGSLLMRLSEKILGGRTDAEECLNDAYFGIWKSIPPERPESLRAYCCKVVRNLSFKRLGYNLAEKRSPHSEVSLEELEASLSCGENFSDFENVDFSIAVNEFLRDLKPEMRAAFLKRYYLMDSVPEIAADLGMSESKVKSLLLRARKRFIGYLNAKGDI